MGFVYFSMYLMLGLTIIESFMDGLIMCVLRRSRITVFINIIIMGVKCPSKCMASGMLCLGCYSLFLASPHIKTLH